MVDIIGRAKVIVEGDVDSASIDAAGGKIGSSLKKGAVIGVAALGTLAVAGVKAFKAFEEAEAQSRKLATVLGNMGESQAVEGVEKLADSLMRLTGVDDEVIKQGQTILATFSHVAESAGEIGGTFERATKASLDLAAAGFGTVESASVMLGKALQDPVKGVTALSRAGVTFSEDQKAMIASLVETGDAAAAQKIILEEVEKQVQGTAEANATESAKIATAWGEVQESIGNALAELTGGEISSFSESLLAMADAIEGLAESEGWEETGKQLQNINDDLQDSDTFLGMWAESNRDAAKSLGELLSDVTKSVPEFRDAFSDHQSLWAQWGEKIGGVLDDVIDKIKDYIYQTTLVGSPDVKYPGNTLSANAADRNAVGGPVSGLTWVGERGPELVDLPNGSYVHSAINSQEMLASSGTTQIFNITTTGEVSDLVTELDWWGKYGSPSLAVNHA